MIQARCVLKVHVDFTNPPKEKFLIIVGVSNDGTTLAGVLINSRINPNINYSPELISLHIKLLQTQNTFLSYDSYADCSKLHYFKYDELNDKIQEDNSILRGSISASEFELMKQALQNGDIKGKIIKKYNLF